MDLDQDDPIEYYTFCLKRGQSGRNDAESGNAVVLLAAGRSTDRMTIESSGKVNAARPVNPGNHRLSEL